jgi:formiminotetrahydrofolate cyclodeaminase
MTDPAPKPDPAPDRDSLWQLGLAEFRDRTASDAPTPGGGSAAMVAAATGCGLVLMALKVTARRPDTGDALDPLIEAGQRRLAELSDHADADIAVFERFMAALTLPKETEAEKDARRAALADAAVAATEVPLNAAQCALETLDLASRAAGLAHKTIVSDVAAGADLLHGALNAVLWNVDINLKSVKDEALRADYAASRAHLQQAGDGRHAAIRREIAARLG